MTKNKCALCKHKKYCIDDANYKLAIACEKITPESPDWKSKLYESFTRRRMR